MAIQREIERNGLLLEEKEGYEYLESPLWFGAEGHEPEKTQITDEPLNIPESEYIVFTQLCKEISDYISNYSLEANTDELGINPQYLKDTLLYDDSRQGNMLYGGLDVYMENDVPKVLEINSRVQAMGLQDTRLDYLGVEYQPRMIDQFIENLQDEGYERVMVLGSRKNPFWRSHLKLAQALEGAGIQSFYGSAEDFDEILNTGFEPEAIIRKCSSSYVLYAQGASRLREEVLEKHIPFINSLSSTFYGDRGFLGEIAEGLPELFPRQIELKPKPSEEEIINHPWLKLETGDEYAYVVNFNRLRKWARDGLVSLINRDFDEFESIVGEKKGSDARKLKQVGQKIGEVPQEQVKWIAQKHIEPPSARIKFQDELQDFTLLHRVYWIKGYEGEVKVSIEGFGCTDKQYSQSKGKINAGTGVSVPMVVLNSKWN